MPIKWTPEIDQLLLLKIIETSEVSINAEEISRIWPANTEDQRPTPRAIRERLFRLRSKSKPSGDVEGANSSANDGSQAVKKTATPRKKGATTQAATNAGVKKSVSPKKKGPAKTATKVKVEQEEDEGDYSDDGTIGGQSQGIPQNDGGYDDVYDNYGQLPTPAPSFKHGRSYQVPSYQDWEDVAV